MAILKNIKSALMGKKTYIIAVCIGIVAVLQYLNIIGPQTAATLVGILGAGGVATLRAAISK